VSETANTLFLRLAGPMQAWGTESRLQIRRTDKYPSKSGALGIILCAMGVERDNAGPALERLAPLQMAVRIDHPGGSVWDYHTAGAGIGIRQAKGGIKLTATTKEPETLLSRRQYLFDASFLVALQGDGDVVREAATALQDPVWPVYLGRKCCIPTEPVFAGTGEYKDLVQALCSQPLQTNDRSEQGSTIELTAVIEHQPGTAVPPGARLVYDVPRTLRNPSHGPRWVVPAVVTAKAVSVSFTPSRDEARRRVNYASDQWRAIRAERLAVDCGLCIFCKSQAEEVHHVTYENAGRERIEDLRSLCKLCHDACTQLEYGHGMTSVRVDPADPSQRDAILGQVQRLLTERRIGRRERVREAVRQSFATQSPER
jgi:CRISPR system Cascade subunit CasD